jgi:hypothetical protein
MLWALERIGLVVGSTLALNLALAAVPYAAWVLMHPSRRTIAGDAPTRPR